MWGTRFSIQLKCSPETPEVIESSKYPAHHECTLNFNNYNSSFKIPLLKVRDLFVVLRNILIRVLQSLTVVKREFRVPSWTLITLHWTINVLSKFVLHKILILYVSNPTWDNHIISDWSWSKCMFYLSSLLPYRIVLMRNL